MKNGASDLAALRAALAPRGLALSEPLGFENTYALAVSRAVATKLGLTKISDLAAHPELRVGAQQRVRRVGATAGPASPSATACASRRRRRSITRSPTRRSRAARPTSSTSTRPTRRSRASTSSCSTTISASSRPTRPCSSIAPTFRAACPAFARVLERMRGAIDATAMQKMNARAELDGVPVRARRRGLPRGQRARARPSERVGLARRHARRRRDGTGRAT